MNDSISRESAINTVLNAYRVCDTGSMEDYRDLMLEFLKDLPPAEPKMIPIANITVDTEEIIKILKEGHL